MPAGRSRIEGPRRRDDETAHRPGRAGRRFSRREPAVGGPAARRRRVRDGADETGPAHPVRFRSPGLYALKGVVAANGSPAVHGRDLAELWNRAEALDGGINAPRDDWKLKGLSRYADAVRETLVSARRGARIYRGVRRTIEALVEHAEKGRCAGRPGCSRAAARVARRHVPGDKPLSPYPARRRRGILRCGVLRRLRGHRHYRVRPDDGAPSTRSPARRFSHSA